MLFDYANVLVFLGLGAFLCAFMMVLGSLLRPSNPERTKRSTYECGEVVEGPSWINFNIRFYVVALVFVVFDVEMAFVYPVVAVFRDQVASGRGLFALLEVALFVGVLACGLVYVWRKGDLEWMKRTGAPGEAAVAGAAVAAVAAVDGGAHVPR